MSKLLKAVAARHRPHLAAKMTAENGYDETKHLSPSDLHAAGILNKLEADDLAGCIDDLAKDGSNAAGFLKAAQAGETGRDNLNNEAFVEALMAELDPEDEDDTEGADEDSDEDVVA